jgi:inositol oxygenase
MYKPNCGINNLMMSWGHDEYLYRVLKHNKTTLPEKALMCIRYYSATHLLPIQISNLIFFLHRFHSFYPWHTSGDYDHLLLPEDEETKEWVNIFK